MSANGKTTIGHRRTRRVPSTVRFEVSPRISNSRLNDLYSQAWPRHKRFAFTPVLRRSLGWICAREGKELVGFVYLAWDGAQHAFLLEPTVLPRVQRRGIGRELVLRAVRLAHRRGCEWVHVDWEAGLAPFYWACGFRRTQAGVIHLSRHIGQTRDS
jgi:GNAT superfamily N-acetyltransferase